MRRRGGTLLGRRPLRVAALVVVLLAAVAGCAAPQDGQALAAGSVTAGLDPTGVIRGTDGGDDDRLAAATLHDLQLYWEREYPQLAAGRPFVPLAGSYSVDSTVRDAASTAPCSQEPADLEGNAYYCPRADVLAFDRSALVPVLRADFGDAAVVVVVAHEFGHAVQQRLGATGAVGPGGSPVGGTQFSTPTILLEGQADCYAATFLRQVRDGALPDLRTGAAGVDGAMSALVTFRDPVGTGASDADAHGNAYDRVSSFQIGFEGGPASCAAMTVQNRLFTQRTFTSLSDAETGGNLPLDQLVNALGKDLDRFYSQVVRSRNRPWTGPRTVPGVGCDGGDAGDPQGAISYCPSGPTVSVDATAAQAEHGSIGDFATGTLLASRYGLATLAALGRPTDGPDAGRAALCLAGAYTASVGAPGTDFALSPGDLDEAVSLLLRDADASRGADGATSQSTAYARVTDFRAGIDGGPDACLGS